MIANSERFWDGVGDGRRETGDGRIEKEKEKEK